MLYLYSTFKHTRALSFKVSIMASTASTVASKQSSTKTSSVAPMKSITITVVNQHKDQYSHTETEYSIKNICDVEMNVIRRIIYEHIPVYGFFPKWIKISNNNTVFHNDYMRERISLLPVPADINDRSTMKYFKYDKTIAIPNNSTKYEETVNDVNDGNDGNEEDDGDEDRGAFQGFNESENKDGQVIDDYNDEFNNISMYFEKENLTNKIIDVDILSDDCTFHYKGKRIDNFYSSKLPLIQLQPGHKIRCLAVTKIGTGKMHEIWSCGIIGKWEDKSPEHFVISLESMGQLAETEIMYRASMMVCSLMDYFEEYLEANESTAIIEKELNKISIKVKDNTIGNATVSTLINYHLQNHKDIVFCGPKQHLLEWIFELTVVTNGKTTIVKILKDVIHTIKSRFTDFASKIDKLQ